MNHNGRILIIGIGNEYRSDDAVGLYVARELAKLEPPYCDIREFPGEGSQLLNAWQGYHRIILVDAVRSSTAPGTIHRIDALREVLPENWVHLSVHTISLPDAIDLARSLNQLPDMLLVFGIEGACFEPGTGLADEVRTAADRLVGVILNETKKYQSS